MSFRTGKTYVVKKILWKKIKRILSIIAVNLLLHRLILYPCCIFLSSRQKYLEIGLGSNKVKKMREKVFSVADRLGNNVPFGYFLEKMLLCAYGQSLLLYRKIAYKSISYLKCKYFDIYRFVRSGI